MLACVLLLFSHESVANEKVVAYDAHHLQYTSSIRCYLFLIANSRDGLVENLAAAW